MQAFRNINQKVADIVFTPAINSVLILAARVLASSIFIMAGYGKITSYAGARHYMQSHERASRHAATGHPA